MSIELLAEVVGASNVPGSIIGDCSQMFGYPATGLPRYTLKEGKDGIMETSVHIGYSEPGLVPYNLTSWTSPPMWVQSLTLMDLIPTQFVACSTTIEAGLNRERYKIPYKPEVLINHGSNLLFSAGDTNRVAQFLSQFDFVVTFSLWIDETAEAFSDIVLPDTCHLERLDPAPNVFHHHYQSGLAADWAITIRQPAVPPLYERRSISEVMQEVCYKVGVVAEYNTAVNMAYGLAGEYALLPDREYTREEVVDRIYKCWLGPDKGLDYMKRHGLVTWKKKVEEVYGPHFVKARLALYPEFILDVKENVEKVAGEQGIELDLSVFKPLPDWTPCRTFQTKVPGYDLTAIYYRVPWHIFSYTYQIPLLDEIGLVTEPFSYFACINTETGRKLGLKDGDWVFIEATNGARVKGRARLVEGVHPEVVAIAHNGGHWSKGMPRAHGKGIFFAPLLTQSREYLDWCVGTMCCDSKVKVYKAG